MEEKKKTDWMKFLTLMLCVLLLIVNFWQGKRLEDLERSISEAQMNITADILEMESTFHTQLREEDKLVQNWNVIPSVNMEKRCLDLGVSAVLKEWREDTAAEVLWTGDGGTVGGAPRPCPATGRETLPACLRCPWTGGGWSLPWIS